MRGRVRLKRRGLHDSKTLAIQNTNLEMFQRSLGFFGTSIGWNFNSFVIFCMHVFLYFASSFLEPLLAGKVVLLADKV